MIIALNCLRYILSYGLLQIARWISNTCPPDLESGAPGVREINQTMKRSSYGNDINHGFGIGRHFYAQHALKRGESMVFYDLAPRKIFSPTNSAAPTSPSCNATSAICRR